MKFSIKLLEIILHTGWVLLDCCGAQNRKIERLQSAMTYVNKELSDVLLVVAKLQEKVDNNTTTESSSASTDVVMSTTDIG